MTKDKNSTQEFNEKIDKLATNDNLWMDCTYKTMDKDGNYVRCSIRVLKQNLDKNNQNNNYCLNHQELVDRINQKRRQETISEFIESVKACILQMPNNKEFIEILNHVKKSFNISNQQKKLKENIIAYCAKEKNKIVKANDPYSRGSWDAYHDIRTKLDNGEFDV